MSDRASERLMFEEAWRNERILNHFRVAFYFVAAVAASLIQVEVLHAVSSAILVFGGWAVFLLIFSHTWLKHHFNRWIPWLLSTAEIGILALAFSLARQTALEMKPEIADRQVGLFVALLLMVLAVNILRFTWRLALFSAVLCTIVLFGLELYWGALSPLSVPEFVILTALGLLVAYSSRRFSRLMKRLSIEIRATQAERVTALRSLVAGVCHELNTPLGTLQSNAQLSGRALEMIRASFSQEELDTLESTRPKLHRALKSLDRMSKSSSDAASRIDDTVASLKSFARLDEAEVKTVDIHECLESALRLLANELSKAELERDFAEIPPIAVRPGELNQVFMHIVRNAAQAMPNGGKITLKTRLEEQQAVLEIVDRGVGIPKDRLETLFLPAFSSNQGRTKMGFGLSASQTIVRDHGGEITVESEVGRGTTVRIELPLTGPLAQRASAA